MRAASQLEAQEVERMWHSVTSIAIMLLQAESDSTLLTLSCLLAATAAAPHLLTAHWTQNHDSTKTAFAIVRIAALQSSKCDHAPSIQF